MYCIHIASFLAYALIFSAFAIGVVDIENVDGTHDAVAIDWGYVKIDENKVIVLVDGAVYVAGNSESEIAQYIEKKKLKFQICFANLKT